MRTLFALMAAAMLTATPAVAQDRKAEIAKIVFELCPKLLDGSLDLTCRPGAGDRLHPDRTARHPGRQDSPRRKG